MLLLSLILVALGQPAWVPECGLVSAVLGYALFWKAILRFERRKHRFWLSLSWFGLVHAVQLSWMTSTTYMGPLILLVYLFLLLGLGIQFALFSSFLRFQDSFLKALAAAGIFVLLEWSRLFLFTGFPWNPAGLALAGNRYSIQFAAIFGVYGLSFWVILTNLAALRFFLVPAWKRAAIWSFLVLLPYGFGFFNERIAKSYFVKEEPFQVATIETALFVEEKYRGSWRSDLFISPLKQWERIFGFLNHQKKMDLIVLPEAALPYGMERPFCPFDVFQKRWEHYFESKTVSHFPPLIFPYAYFDDGKWMITNAFVAQSLSNHFHADLIAGFDHDEVGRKMNAAFLFRPNEKSPDRYDKRILVPVGEYIPFDKIGWVSEFLAKNFGIEGSFSCGKEAKIFSARHPIGIAICLEEMYGSLIRDLRQKGAKFLVTLSNDVWFPFSKLAKEHFDHARIRAVENGVFLIRSSNMGMTGGVDCFGQPIRISSPGQAGAVFLSFPPFSYPTLYSWWGDQAILFLSIFFIAATWIRHRKKLPLNEQVE